MVYYLREGTCWAFTEGAVRVKFSLDTDVTWQLSEGDCNHRDKRPGPARSDRGLGQLYHGAWHHGRGTRGKKGQ